MYWAGCSMIVLNPNFGSWSWLLQLISVSIFLYITGRSPDAASLVADRPTPTDRHIKNITLIIIKSTLIFFLLEWKYYRKKRKRKEYFTFYRNSGLVSKALQSIFHSLEKKNNWIRNIQISPEIPPLLINNLVWTTIMSHLSHCHILNIESFECSYWWSSLTFFRVCNKYIIIVKRVCDTN